MSLFFKLTFSLIIFFNTTVSSQEFKHKMFCGDTSQINILLNTTIFCNRKEVDTIFITKKISILDYENFAIYYDKFYSQPAKFFQIKNDTVYEISFYRNGKKKKEDRNTKADNLTNWFYSADWCENGQLIFEGNPNETNPQNLINYHCNGQKKFEAFFYKFQLWGKVKHWHSNGKQSAEEVYVEFDKQLIDKGLLESKLLSQKYWDENGNPIDFLDLNGQTLNAHNLPIYTGNLEKFKTENDTVVSYYDIDGKYGFSINELRNKIYDSTKIHNPICKYGVVYITFFIEPDGSITNPKIDLETNNQIKNAFLEALFKIKKWKPIAINGKPARILTVLELESEKINPENIFED